MSAHLWSERPIEQARLLNPAFLAALLWSCARGYGSVDDKGAPYPILFVAVPVVLHKATRESLPRSTRTSLAAWLGEHPQVHVRFAERAKALVPLIKEGLLFGSGGRLLVVSSPRVIAASRPNSVARLLRDASNEVTTCMRKAEFVGKWFASSGDYSTVMALWGVAP